MQRYKSIDDCKIGDRTVLDNTLGIVKDIQRVKLVGEIKEKKDNDKLLLSFKLNTQAEPFEVEVPYYLLQ